ncbi:MAG: hypothetical protein U9Q99_02580 [Nanoarchaeota archaeon]|nr:hypothetical protein [Nanoarchaeota archaeon]
MNYDKKDKSNRMMKILIGVIIVLVVFIAFFFLIKPGYNKFVYNQQMQGYNIGVTDIYTNMLTQIENSGAYQVPISENQTLILVPYNPNLPATPAA